MSDDLEARRRNRQPGRRHTIVGRTTLPKPIDVKTDGPPAWAARFVIPRNACEACAQHWHHKCWGANVLLDPIPDCPCDCGDRKDPARLSPQAWADLALHAPDQVWVAAMFDRQRAAGLHMCETTDNGRMRAYKEERVT